MFFQGVFLATLAVLRVTHCLDEEEKIDPVKLSFNCIQVLTTSKEPEKSPVIFIHGLSASKKYWDGVKQVVALRTERRACAIDLRNHGDSPWTDRTDVASMVVDLDKFLDEQNIKKANLIGHSLGGKVAVHYALNYPDRVDSIVIEDMRPNGVTKEGGGTVDSYLLLMSNALKKIPKDADEDQARKIIVDEVNEQLEKMNINERIDEQFAKDLEIHLVDGQWKYKFNIDKFIGLKDLEKDVLNESKGLYDGPALFIYGTESPFKVNEDKENIMKLFPKAELQPVKGAGHDIHTRFREFDDIVIKFLNKI